MRSRIFKGIFSVAILVWFACLILILGALYLQYSSESGRQLKNETILVAEAVKQSGMGYFDDIKLPENHRITWVDTDGNVLYDTSVPAEKQENHKNRPEIRKALKKGYGENTRYSKTLSERTMYSAQRLSDGTVIRVSQTQFGLAMLLLSMAQPILIVLVLAIILSLILASRIAKRIVKPINEINLDNPEEAELYEEVKPLVHRITEQNRTLNKQISDLRGDVDDKIKEADFRKEFTANVSHELKTPLTSISGFAEIIKNGLVKEEDIQRFAGRIYDEAQRLVALVGDIIKLSQLDEKQVAAKKERLDLYQMCRDARKTLDAAAQEKQVTVRLNGRHIYVDGVSRILEEMIYNLCENAIKYNKDGGSVIIEIFERNERPVLRVSDTGIGIPKEDVERVFERFFRVNKSHSKEIGGTGLGLSIVKHGAAYHNATIELKSVLHQGTTITILF